MNLRTRVAMICGGLTAVVAVIAGLVLVQFVENELLGEVDGELARRAEAFQPVIADLVTRDGSLVAGLQPVIGSDPARGTVDGELVFEFGAVPEVDGAIDEGFDTVAAEGAQWRRRTSVIDPGAGSVEALHIELFAPLAPTLDQVGVIRSRAIAVALAAGLLGAVLGSLLGRSITRPLDRLVGQASAIEASGGQVTRIAAGGNTEEVNELEAALNDLLDRMNAALESARAFAADASHELRTPLTAMAANIDILNRRPDLDPKMRAEIIDELGERQAWIEQLLTALRELARSELADPAEMEELDLADLADSVLAAVGRHDVPGRPDDPTMLGVGDRLTLVASDAHPVLGVPESLRILIDNLVRNAMLHGRSSDGLLDATITVVTEPGPSANGETGDTSVVVLTVEDHGSGIDPADSARLTRRFERGATTAPGTGLGLALVEQQVKLHNGTLTLGRSAVGGARVEVRLPTRSGPGTHRPDEPSRAAARRNANS